MRAIAALGLSILMGFGAGDAMAGSISVKNSHGGSVKVKSNGSVKVKGRHGNSVKVKPSSSYGNRYYLPVYYGGRYCNPSVYYRY